MVAFSRLFNTLYDLLDRGSLRALTLILSLTLAGCVFMFVGKTYDLKAWQGIAMVWAVCTGVIFGVGLRPRKLRWRIVFLPLPAILIVIVGLIYYLI